MLDAMATPDSGWLKALDLNGYQAFAVTATAGAVIALNHYEISIFARTPDYVLWGIGVFGLYGFCLLVSKITGAAYRGWRARVDREAAKQKLSSKRKRY